jgi:hypothetical protein
MHRFLPILILLAPLLASAETIQLNKPVTCDSALLVFQALVEQAGEKPIWVGKGDGADTSKTVILANEKTKSWTIVQFDKNMACVLGSGVGSQLIFTGPVI